MTTQQRNDGWVNLFKATGTSKDTTRAGRFLMPPSRDQYELEALYTVGGLAGRIIDVPIDDMLRPGVEVDGPDGEALKDRMEELSVMEKMADGMKWGRLYGGAVSVIVCEGVDLYQPRPTDATAKRIIDIRSYDRWNVTKDYSSIEQDAASALFGQCTRYMVTPYSTGIPYHVHRDHLLFWPGRKTPPRVKIQNSGWDYSCLDPLFDAIQDLDNAIHSSSAILQSFVQDTLAVKGLTDLLASGQEDVVRKRLEIMDLSRHVLNMTLLDSDGEQYNRIASSVAGVADLIEGLRMDLQSKCGIPGTKLFGRSPGGMNATGDNDTRNYYDDLDSQRKQIVLPQLEKVIRLLYLERGPEPKAWSIKPNPLWQMDDKEAADVRKTVAEADAQYIDRGVFSAQDVMFARMQEDGERKPLRPVTDQQIDEWLRDNE
jgi:uncharacterized protein